MLAALSLPGCDEDHFYPAGFTFLLNTLAFIGHTQFSDTTGIATTLLVPEPPPDRET